MAAATECTGSPGVQDSPLLGLPAELRNTVYHLALASHDGEQMDITLSIVKRRTAPLKVCSRIRNEATKIFYATNAFMIRDLLGKRRETNRFFKNAGPNAQLIPKLAVQLLPPQPFEQLASLTYRVTLIVDQDTELAVTAAYHKVRHISVETTKQRVVEVIEFGVCWRNIVFEKVDVDLKKTPSTEEGSIQYLVYLLQLETQSRIVAIGQKAEDDAK